jgi:type 1 fimbria pilin
MNGRHLSVGISFFFALSGVCLAATPASQGSIQFRGSIVEPSCLSHAGQNSAFEINGCAPLNLGTAVNVRSVAPISSVSAVGHSAVNVKLLADNGQSGRDYAGQYQLVDERGTPVRSGMYVITLTAP